MGLFLTFSLFNNAEEVKVREALRHFAYSANGGLAISNVDKQDPNFCSISIKNNITIVTYPANFTEYIQSSQHFSKSLRSSVYTFCIYDGDYWMLYVFKNGFCSSRFNPYPDYWNEKEDRKQIETWNFNLSELCEDFNLSSNSVDNYFIEWNTVGPKAKAYNNDEFFYGDCNQVFDLLSHFSITFSDVINYEKQGTTFKLWTANLPLAITHKVTFDDIKNAKRYSTDPIKLNIAEIEHLLGLSVDYFIASLINKQSCSYCKEFKTLDGIAIDDYYLSINDVTVRAFGHCKKCGGRVDFAFGFTNIQRLLDVLNS